MITLSRRKLEWMLRARGPDLSAWPDRDRAAAIDLLRHSPEARQALADALVREEAPDTDGETDCIVLRRMQSVLRRKLAPLPLLLRGLGAAALVACMAVGVYLSAAQAADPESSTDMFTSAQSVSVATIDP